MPRRSAIWERSGRGWYTTINGRQVRLGGSRKEAEAAFAKLTLDGGKRPPRLDVASLTQLWLNDLKANRREQTWASAKQFARYWCKVFGRMQSADIRPHHVLSWLDRRDSWGTATRSVAIRAVRACLSWGHERGYLDSHPLSRLKAPKTPRRKAITEADLARWLACVESPQVRLWVDVSLATGCRPGELFGLEARHIVEDRSRADASGKMGGRPIFFPVALTGLLEALMAKHPDGPLLRSPMGRRWNTASLTWHFRRASERSGVEVVPYHLRHVFATRSLRVNGEVITAKLMGHKSLTMLHAHYESLEADDLRAAVERISPVAKDAARRG